MGAAIDNLSLKELVAAGVEVAYSTTATLVQATAAADQANAFRFVRVQAHDGDLLVEIGYADNSAMRAAVPTSGSRRVRNGTETFQLPGGGLQPEVKVAAVTGTVHGAILWGR